MIATYYDIDGQAVDKPSLNLSENFHEAILQACEAINGVAINGVAINGVAIQVNDLSEWAVVSSGNVRLEVSE